VRVSTPRRQRPVATIVAIAFAAAPFAAFAGPSLDDKATARELAKEGIAAEQKGDCATAIDRLERAESLYHAPPHLQFLARCYTKTGRLVDATETWRKLTLETLPANAPPAFKDAINEAQIELPKVEPRLARLTLKTAQKYDGFSVEVDSKAWPNAALDVPRVIDPGKHLVRAHATGFKTNEQSIELSEGKSESITITLEPGSDGGSVPPIASTSSSATTTATTTAPTALPSTSTTSDTPRRSSTVKTIGFVTTGIGVAALVGGAVTGYLAASKFNKLENDCPDRKNCPASDLDQRKSSIKTLTTTTNLLLIGGGVLAAAGLTMVLLAPSGRSSSPSVSLQFSPVPSGGHVTLSGSF
jgi:hypothetical protein